jgi:predicted aldo/keto reductase-like oxidoreductase
MHDMVGKAIKGLPRDKLTVQTKLQWRRDKDVAEELDRFRKELGTDYLDIVLLHNTDAKGWPEKLERIRDGLSAAKEKGIIRAHGVSVHGLPGLREVARCKWVEVALLRINHAGHHMDGEKGEWAEPSRFDEAMAEIEKIGAAGKSIIAMKLVGNGDFTAAEERERAIRFVLGRPFVTAVDIGFKSPAEIDEAMERIDRALGA